MNVLDTPMTYLTVMLPFWKTNLRCNILPKTKFDKYNLDMFP